MKTQIPTPSWIVPTLSSVALGLALICLPSSAQAFGGLGFELGGHAGFGGLSQGVSSPNFYGGQAALVLQVDLPDLGPLSTSLITRAEGSVSGVGVDKSGGIAGLGGADLLLRLGLELPVVTPFIELGGGAAAGGGAGTLDASSVNGAVDQSVSGAMWAGTGYAGLGLTLGLPLLPYFELRVGTHTGALLPLNGAPPLSLSDPTLSRIEAHIGMGWRL